MSDEKEFIPFCRDHSEVMRCLGALEEGQKTMTDDMKDIKKNIGVIAQSVTNGKITTAIEKTKGNILYTAIYIIAAGGVAALVTYFLKLI